jgi:hypothetical protein
MKLKSFIAIIFMAIYTHAGLLFNYHQLTLKNLDQMNTLVKNKIKESKSAYSGKAVPLKEALQSVLSRPDSDDMISKIIDPLRNKLDKEDAQPLCGIYLVRVSKKLKHPFGCFSFRFSF